MAGNGLATACPICSNVISKYCESHPGYGSYSCFVVVIASLLRYLQMVMQVLFRLYMPILYLHLSLLIVVNCILLGCVEALGAKQSIASFILRFGYGA